MFAQATEAEQGSAEVAVVSEMPSAFRSWFSENGK
jgi:hypothetical protein